MKCWLWLVCFSCLLALSSARANLVTNGDFGTGNFNGWLVSNNADCGVTRDIESGDYYAFFQANGSTTYLFQQLATTAGANYTLSFSLAYSMADPLFTLSWGGIQLTNITTGFSSSLQVYTLSGIVASSASTPLVFSFAQENPGAEFELANVSVDLESATVPEPSTWVSGACAAVAMLATGTKFQVSRRLRSRNS